MFSSYVENPTNIRFEGEDADERILLLLRAHPITNLSWILSAGTLALFPFFVPSIFLLLEINLSLIPQIYINALLIINYLLVLVIIFEGFLQWYFNVSILTNKRIVDVDFISLLRKNIDLAPLSQIQEANSSSGGLLPMIFHYGDVFVQTAGARVAIDFHNVPEPHKVADRIMDEAHKITGVKNGS